MNETVVLCAWVDDLLSDVECSELATFRLRWRWKGGSINEGTLESCHAHLADLAKGLYGLYPLDEVRLEEISQLS